MSAGGSRARIESGHYTYIETRAGCSLSQEPPGKEGVVYEQHPLACITQNTEPRMTYRRYVAMMATKFVEHAKELV